MESSSSMIVGDSELVSPWSTKYIDERRAVRLRNLDPAKLRLTPAKLRELKSDMKKTTTLLRRIREFRLEYTDLVLQDIVSLNLNRYVTEAAQNIIASILDGKSKGSDIPSLVVVCSALHQQYEKFAMELLTELRKKWTIGGMFQIPDEALAAQEASRNRVMTRFISELWFSAVTSEWKMFRWILVEVTKGCEGDQNPHHFINALSILQVMVRSIGTSLYGAQPWPKDDTDSSDREAPWTEVLTSAQAQSEIRKSLVAFVQKCTQCLEVSCKELEDIWMQNMDAIHSTGELPTTMKEQFGIKKKLSDRLYASLVPIVTTLPGDSCVHLRTPPTLQELMSAHKKENSSSIVFLSGLANYYTVGDIVWSSDNLYDSPEEKMFYSDIEEVGVEIEEALALYHQDVRNGVLAPPLTRVYPPVEEADFEKIDAHLKVLYSTCHAKESSNITNWVRIFLDSDHVLCHYRFRGSRDLGRNFILACKKRLLKFLRDCPTQDLGVIPGLCRVALLLQGCGEPSLVDVAELFTKAAEDELEKHLGQGTGELSLKLKNSHIVGEATKFRLLPAGTALRMIAFCSDEGNIRKPHVSTVLFHLLNCCGTFLMRNPMTHSRFEVQLQSIHQNIRTLGGENELRLRTVLEKCEAITKAQTSTPHDVNRITRESLKSPEEQYLRHLIRNKLDKTNAQEVATQILKFNWEDRGMRRIIFTALRNPTGVNASVLPFLAKVVESVSNVYDALGNWIVDDLIEKIRRDIEQRTTTTSAVCRLQTRVLADMRFVGELFKVRIVHVSTLFYILYMVALYLNEFDSSTDYSRITMITTLCDIIVGHLLPNMNDRRRFQFFLCHFYVMMHAKVQPLPISVTLSVLDMLETARTHCTSGFQLDSFPEKREDSERLLVRYQQRLTRLTTDPINKYYGFFTNISSRFLHPINEGDEFIGVGSDDSALVKSNDPPLSHRASHDRLQDFASDEISKMDSFMMDGANGSKIPSRKSNAVLKNEDDEFEALLREATKESFDTVKHQTNLRTMAGKSRVLSHNIIPHMMHMRGILQKPELKECLGVPDNANGRILGLVTRKKVNPSGKSSAPKAVMIKPIHVPIESPIVQSQIQNLTQTQMEKDNLKRATLNRVQYQMEKDGILSGKIRWESQNLTQEPSQSSKPPRNVPKTQCKAAETVVADKKLDNTYLQELSSTTSDLSSDECDTNSGDESTEDDFEEEEEEEGEGEEEEEEGEEEEEEEEEEELLDTRC